MFPGQENFNEMVWEIARQIPLGRVFTYGQIANLIPPPPGMPEAEYKAQRARWAGSAMSKCPPDVPWQRVLNAQGKISLPGKLGDQQRRLLEAEGITFDDRQRIDLTRYGWDGPARDWLQERGLLIPSEDYQQPRLL
jgi:methylated-DNA-protein-cysteine methyltransferase-like protein